MDNRTRAEKMVNEIYKFGREKAVKYILSHLSDVELASYKKGVVAGLEEAARWA